MAKQRLTAGKVGHVLAIVLSFAALGSVGCGEVMSNPNECEIRTWQPVFLANATFDGDGGWSLAPLSNPPICETDTFGIPADTGTLAACFGIVNEADQSLSQPIMLPPGTTQVRLRGKHCLVTTEPDAVVKDTLVIEVLDASTLQSTAALASWSNIDAAMFCSWTEFEVMASVTELPDVAILSMRGLLDDLEITTFFIDSLELDAFGC